MEEIFLVDGKKKKKTGSKFIIICWIILNTVTLFGGGGVQLPRKKNTRFRINNVIKLLNICFKFPVNYRYTYNYWITYGHYSFSFEIIKLHWKNNNQHLIMKNGMHNTCTISNSDPPVTIMPNDKAQTRTNVPRKLTAFNWTYRTIEFNYKCNSTQSLYYDKIIFYY